MRISDWSSDVCSADLLSGQDALPADAFVRGGKVLPKQLPKHPNGWRWRWHPVREPMVRELKPLRITVSFKAKHYTRTQPDLDRSRQYRFSRVRTERFHREPLDRKSTRLNSSHYCAPRMPSSACKKKKTTQLRTKPTHNH